MLERHGYSVKSAAGGEEALAIYRETKQEIELIILDLNMPGMDGNRCLKELLAFDARVKVIVASGFSPEETKLRTVKAGAAAFLGKPFVLADMLAAIRSVLDG